MSYTFSEKVFYGEAQETLTKAARSAATPPRFPEEGAGSLSFVGHLLCVGPGQAWED